MELYWVDDRLAVGPRPEPGAGLGAALDTAVEQGVEILVSCLMPDEERALGLADEERLAKDRVLVFERLPITDIQAPADTAGFDVVIARLVVARAAGRRVAIHCKMGMGRAPLTAASVLVAEGRSPADAWALVRERRGHQVPDNASQEAFVSDFATRQRR